MIGSRAWLIETEIEYKRRGWPFDAVRAYRRETLRELTGTRPRKWSEIPWVLHDHEHASWLHPRFVAYLDNHLDAHIWDVQFKVLKHQTRQWWANRLEEVLTD